MRGRILTYSVQENAGIISGDDGTRYAFTGAEWRENAPPLRGAYVDFEISGADAVDIFMALGGVSTEGKEKIVAGLLAILVGGLGIHKFYLGYRNAGIIHLVIFFAGMIPLFLGTVAISLFALAEGIIYLIKSDEEFERTYIIGRKEWL